MKKIAVLTGAGISRESGLSTFRDSDGLWNSHDFKRLCTIEAWEDNPQEVIDFYNHRRAELQQVQPNGAHRALAALEDRYRVDVITQNVDDLHERAGSTHILHLHGELKKARSSKNPDLIYEIGYRAIEPGERCEDGSLLRPHIVWFGEAVPAIEEAVRIVEQADIFVVVGTSLEVYPAAGLLHYVRPGSPIYVIDPQIPSSVSYFKNVTTIAKVAVEGVKELVEKYL